MSRGLPGAFWVANALTAAIGIGLQLMGVYASVIAFGAWPTAGLYAVGCLALLLHGLVIWRSAPC